MSNAMTTQNWPDPKRPGVPMFPERDGWHVIDARSCGSTVLSYWNGKEWSAGDCVRGLNSNPEWWRYNGAVLTPTQINEMLAAERAKERERIIAALDNSAKAAADDFTPMQHGALMSITLDIIEGIRALGDAT